MFPRELCMGRKTVGCAHRNGWSGSLALGLSSKQEGFPRDKDKNHPSFLRAVQESVLGPWPPDPSGSIMYFGLRVIPQTIPLKEHTLYESWVAFNRWPCAKYPEFSAEISVTGNSDWTRRTKWCGRVVKIELYDRVSQAGSIMGHYAEPINIELPKQTKPGTKGEPTPKPGFPIVFDTGASVSWLPGEVVSQIARHYRRSPPKADDLPATPSSTTGGLDSQSTAASALRGGSTSTKSMPKGNESQTGKDTPVTLSSPFVVDPRNYVPFHEVAITYLAMDEQSHVTVRVEAEHFLYARNPQQKRRHEGLVFPRKTGEHATFGLNWFHAHWVAMYQPTVGVPHMRLAPQTHGSMGMRLILLPPKDGESRKGF
ncbi:hypothetical protein BD413DRAFT_240271 [Trametes elegans]|nr:hypothetical protein BD413DRAFT_240271 [Trametes elegans]